MKIVQINHFSYKAAGSIMMNLHRDMLQKGIESYVVWGRGRKAENDHEYYMDDKLGVNLHALYTRVSDRTGFGSVRSTKRLISWLEKIRPDIIHLHCIHGYYLNLPCLFDYIRKNNVKVIWTQHDCWSFTGHCAYFDSIGCEKWKSGCYDCDQIKTYPIAYVDASKRNWDDKRKLFCGLNARIITPCNWMNTLVKQSFLGEYPVETIYNGVDLSTFKRTKRRFRTEYGIEKKFVVLGVASEWTERKGLKDIIQIYDKLDHNDYQIVIVGLTKKQLRQIPKGIIALQRTNDIQELTDIYSSADLFFNPTYEDNFPTTNLEALACGTPVLTYQTGGAAECISNGMNGFSIPKGSVENAVKIIEEKISMDTIKLDKNLFSKDSMIEYYERVYNE